MSSNLSLLSTPKHGSTAASKEGTVKWNAKKGHYVTSKGKALMSNNSNENNQTAINRKMAEELQKLYNKQPRSLTKKAKSPVTISINTGAAAGNTSTKSHRRSRNQSVKSKPVARSQSPHNNSKELAKLTVPKLKEILKKNHGETDEDMKKMVKKNLIELIITYRTS
jgi:hypothetical protein